MAYRMTLHERAIRFMIRMNGMGLNPKACAKHIEGFITRNGKTYGRRNAEKAIVEAKKMLTLTGSSSE